MDVWLVKRAFEVTEPNQIDVDVAVIDANCNEGGKINIDITGGIGAYTFDWADLTGFDDPKNRSELIPGTYAFTVKDENGCEVAVNNLVVIDDCDGGVTPDTIPSCVNGQYLCRDMCSTK